MGKAKERQAISKSVNRNAKKKTKDSPEFSVSEVFPFTAYCGGQHFYSDEQQKAATDLGQRLIGERRASLGNAFRGGYFLLLQLLGEVADAKKARLPLGTAIRVTYEVVPPTETNKKQCNLEERDKLR